MISDFDTVFISDVHLGTDRCNTKKFLNFLKTLKTKKLVMVGDILDIHCLEKYNTKWNKQHTKCIHKLIEVVKSGIEVVYILGNHDATFRRYSGFTHQNLTMVEEYVHIDTKGKKYLCVHGDKYSEYSSGSWKQLYFNWGYEIITPLSETLKKYFNFSLIEFLKNTPNGKKYIRQYEADIAKYCKKRKQYDGVICGHIHHANIRKIGKLNYMCCGDWCDQCTAIVERGGNYEIKYF